MSFIAMILIVAQDAPPTYFAEVHLKNGSFIKGTVPKVPPVKLKTRYGILEFPLKDLRSISWGDAKREETDTVIAKAGTYKGYLEEMASLEVDTGYGALTIPDTAIKTFRLWEEGDALSDDFQSGSLDRWTVMGTTTWAFVDGRVQ
jgi:hypothetical protein